MLEPVDYVIIGAIVLVFSRGTIFLPGPKSDEHGIGRRIDDLHRKLDLLLSHQGIKIPVPPSGLSPEVERLARNPESKIAAIKLHHFSGRQRQARQKASRNRVMRAPVPSFIVGFPGAHAPGRAASSTGRARCIQPVPAFGAINSPGRHLIPMSSP